MKLLKRITDADILGASGISKAAPRLTARAIVRNPHGQYAVMCAQKYGFYSLPGGGMEPHESPETAVRREVLEETGCECMTVEPLGYVEENRAHCDQTRLSFFFVVATTSVQLNPRFTDAELEEGTSVNWYSWEEAWHLIADAEYQAPKWKFLQARDIAALDAYRNDYLK